MASVLPQYVRVISCDIRYARVLPRQAPQRIESKRGNLSWSAPKPLGPPALLSSRALLRALPLRMPASRRPLSSAVAEFRAAWALPLPLLASGGLLCECKMHAGALNDARCCRVCRHPERPVEPGTDAEDGIALRPGAAGVARAQRPAGKPAWLRTPASCAAHLLCVPALRCVSALRACVVCPSGCCCGAHVGLELAAPSRMRWWPNST